MVKRIFVDFASARIPALRTLPRQVPQFFDYQMRPYRSVNLYFRNRAKRWSTNSLRTNAQHLHEFLTWVENSGIKVNSLKANDLEHYADALCLYKRGNGKG